MAIRPVRGLPRRTRKAPESYVAADFREFVRRGMDVALLEYDDHCARAVKVAADNYIRQHPKELRGVRTGVRQGKCYVWREVQR